MDGLLSALNVFMETDEMLLDISILNSNLWLALRLVIVFIKNFFLSILCLNRMLMSIIYRFVYEDEHENITLKFELKSLFNCMPGKCVLYIKVWHIVYSSILMTIICFL